MGYTYTAVIRDRNNNIVAYADYSDTQPVPEHIQRLAAKEGNTISTTFRKDTKGQYYDYGTELGQRKESIQSSQESLVKQHEEEKPRYERYATLAERSGKQNVGQRVPEQRQAEQSFNKLQEIEKTFEANAETLSNMSGTTIPRKQTKAQLEAKATASATAYQERNLQSTQADFVADGMAYDISEAPRGMTREQAQEYNKSLIAIQMPYILERMRANNKQYTDTQPSEKPKTTESGISKTTSPIPIINKTGTGTYSDPFKAAQPNRSLISPYLGATYWEVDGKQFTIKSDADAYLNQPQAVQWTVGEKTFETKAAADDWINRTVSYGGKDRTFKTVEGAKKFAESLPKSYIGYAPDGRPLQGAPRPIDKNDPRNFLEAETAFPQTFTGLIGNDFFANDKYVTTKPSLMVVATTPKQTWLGAEIERGLVTAEKESIWLQENPKSSNPLLAAYQTIAPIGIAAQKSVLGAMAFGVNYAEQTYSPFLAEKLGIKVKPVAPINVSSVSSGMTVLPYDVEKQKVTVPFIHKEWATRQAQYIRKYGLPEYIGGIVFDWGGMTSAPRMIFEGAKTIGGKVAAPLIPHLGDAAKSAAIVNAPSKIFIPRTRANEISFADFGEKVGKSSLIKSKQVAATQADVRPFIPKKTIPVKEDVGYKPPIRANEVPFREGIIPKEDIKGEIKFSEGFIPNKVEPPLKGKVINPVKLDPYYTPTKRPNEIDLTGGGEVIGRFSNIKSKPVAATQADVRPFIPKKTIPVKEDVGYKPKGRYEGGFKDIMKSDTTIPKELKTFNETQIKLGKGISEGKTILKKKEIKPIEEDVFYKPSKRANEIDLTDAADSPKIIKKEELKSEVPLDLKRELKRIKRKEQPSFKSETISFEGQGKYIAGKSGKQELLQIQKQEEITKQKLVSKRQSPRPIDWTEKIETAKLPSTGKAPIQILIPPTPKEERRKKPTQTSYSAFEIPLHSARPQISARSMTGSSLITSARVVTGARSIEGMKQIQPQKISVSTKQNIATTPKSATAQKSKLFEVQKLESPQKQRPKQVVKEQYKMPTPQVGKPKQVALFKQKQPLKQSLKSVEPPRPVKRQVFVFPPIDPSGKTERKKAKGKKNVDFLANTRLDKIEGFFRRGDIITGDVASAKQLKKDIRYKEGKGKGLGFSGKKLKFVR